MNCAPDNHPLSPEVHVEGASCILSGSPAGGSGNNWGIEVAGETPLLGARGSFGVSQTPGQAGPSSQTMSPAQSASQLC